MCNSIAPQRLFNVTFDNGPKVSLDALSMAREGPRSESNRSSLASLFLVSILEFCLMKERDGTGILNRTGRTRYSVIGVPAGEGECMMGTGHVI